jgi:hypothetical protein
LWDPQGLGRPASVSREHDRCKGAEILRINANSEPEETSFGQYTQLGVFLPELVLIFGHCLSIDAHRLKPPVDFVLFFRNRLGVEPHCVKPSNDFRVFLAEFALVLLGVEAQVLNDLSQFVEFILDCFKGGPHRIGAKRQRPDPSRGGHQE